MAINPRRRQKQLARRAAKRKVQVAKKQRGGLSSSHATFQAKMAAQHPLHECLVHVGLFESGLGHVIVSRRLGTQVAGGVFLIDIYCLGAKDAMFGLWSLPDYGAMVERLLRTGDMAELEPACARKLIEGAVAYARGLGFKPHRDYHKAAPILGDIDPSQCSRVFEFGKDGKPLYVAGPFDSQARINLIRRTLEERCGSDGYHYLIPMSGLNPDESSEWTEEAEDADDEANDFESPSEEGEFKDDPD